mgnify:CR=1 FL=1
MPVLDTEVLFAFNPKDKHHRYAKRLLELIRAGRMSDVHITDVALLEFVTVLRSKGKSTDAICRLLRSLEVIMVKYGIIETCTLTVEALLRAMDFLQKGVSFFDALIAASAESIDGIIISDDVVYNKLGLRRIALKVADEKLEECL